MGTTPGLAWVTVQPESSQASLFIVSGNMLMTFHGEQWTWRVYRNPAQRDPDAIQFTAEAEEDGMRMIGPVQLEVELVASVEEFAQDAIINGVEALLDATWADGDRYAIASVLAARTYAAGALEGMIL